MVPQTQARKARNSSKVNLVISLVFHGVLVFVVLFFAARSGMLGQAAKNLLVTRVKEPPKPKEPEKKPDEPKPDDTPKPTQAPKMTSTPPPAAQTAAAPPPDASAPPPSDAAPFVFDGGRAVNSADALTIYKSVIQESVMAHWHRPEMNDNDKNFVAEMKVNIDPAGHISNPVLQKSSGNTVWDDSVKKAVAATQQLSRNPPKGFPDQVIVRFDVAEEKQDSMFQ